MLNSFLCTCFHENKGLICWHILHSGKCDMCMMHIKLWPLSCLFLNCDDRLNETSCMQYYTGIAFVTPPYQVKVRVVPFPPPCSNTGLFVLMALNITQPPYPYPGWCVCGFYCCLQSYAKLYWKIIHTFLPVPFIFTIHYHPSIQHYVTRSI